MQTEFLVKIWRETSLPMELRREAKRLATELLMFSFVESPVGLEEGALLLGEKNDLSFFDGETLRKIAVLPGEGVVISLRLNLPVLFDAEAGTVHTLGTDGVYEDTQGPLAQIYREMPKEERAAVIDVFYGKRFSCFLSIKSVFCKSDKNSVNVELPSEMEAAQFVVMGNSPGGEQNFIMSKAGIYYSFPFDLMSSGPINIGSTPRPLDQWKTEDFAISEFLSDYKGVGFFQGSQLITLLPSGELALYSADSGQAYVAVPRLAGHKFKRLFLPYFWSPRFSDL